jgi:hypothetical protein
MSAARIRLIHWNIREAAEKAALLQAAGYEVDFETFTPANLRLLRGNLPAAVIIDLSRLPSQGRDVGLQVRLFKSTRLLPLIFAEGAPDKITHIKELLPDAIYTTWNEIMPTIQHALSHTPSEVVVPQSAFAPYISVPLVKKLGIKTRTVIGLINAPPGFEQTLGAVPEGIRWQYHASEPCDLILWFVRSRHELEEGITKIRPAVGKDGLWIIWPKKGSNIATDLTQVVVRKVGLANALVDYKVSAIDETWSGLRFALRKPK